MLCKIKDIQEQDLYIELAHFMFSQFLNTKHFPIQEEHLPWNFTLELLEYFWQNRCKSINIIRIMTPQLKRFHRKITRIITTYNYDLSCNEVILVLLMVILR